MFRIIRLWAYQGDQKSQEFQEGLEAQQALVVQGLPQHQSYLNKNPNKG